MESYANSPLPRSLFPSNCPPPSTQFQVFSTQVLAYVLPTCWVRYSHHASTPPSSIFLLTRVCPPSIPPPRFGSHVFRGGGAPTLLPQARLPRETISLYWGTSPPVDAVGRLALSASTSSRINRCHEGTLVHARTL